MARTERCDRVPDSASTDPTYLDSPASVPSSAPVVGADPSSAALSPCPHTPACPPGPCLPAILRPVSLTTEPRSQAPPPPVPAPSADKDGYDTALSKIVEYAGTMMNAASAVNQIKAVTPRFEGWDLIPVIGIPAIGLPFHDRFNALSDTWADCAAILRTVLEDDSEKLAEVAQKYRTVEVDAKNAFDQLKP